MAHMNPLGPLRYMILEAHVRQGSLLWLAVQSCLFKVPRPCKPGFLHTLSPEVNPKLRRLGLQKSEFEFRACR